MRLISFKAEKASKVGVMLDDKRVADIARTYPAFGSIASLLEAGTVGSADLSSLAGSATADYTIDEIEFEPVIPAPHAIWCIGLNYMSHREETNHWGASEPTTFLRTAASQVGHRMPLVKPSVSEQFDYEGELAVIIGREGRHIPEAEAMSYIGGYSCYNEGSVRDWQKHSKQYGPGKNFWASGSFGPWMVTPEAFGDPEKNQITTRLNGKIVQDSSIDLLIFKIPKLISYLSTVYPLRPGDVIVTGTPAGVGARQVPPRFMRPGDKISVEISNIGTLENPVIGETVSGTGQPAAVEAAAS